MAVALPPRLVDVENSVITFSVVIGMGCTCIPMLDPQLPAASVYNEVCRAPALDWTTAVDAAQEIYNDSLSFPIGMNGSQR